MTEGMAEASPRLKARIAGVFYLGTFLTGGFALFVRGTWSVAGEFASTLCYIGVTLLFYDLFKPVSRSLSLLAALVSLGGCAVGTLNLLHLSPFRISALAIFGFYCLLIGYLIFRSDFLPRILGVLMALGGLAWLTFASPALAKYLSPYNFAPGIFGEGVLTVWLLVKGVNEQRWKEQAGAAASIRA
jgi:hypothetical protein